MRWNTRVLGVFATLFFGSVDLACGGGSSGPDAATSDAASGGDATSDATLDATLDATSDAIGDASAGETGADGASDGGAAFAPPYLDGDCDPIAPAHCGFPLPSSVYTRVDSTSPTGVRVQFGAGTLPTFGSPATHMSPSFYADLDGFSPLQAPMVHLPGATLTGLPTLATYADSMKSTSPTILLDVATGKLLPHFVELDMSGASPADDDKRTLMLRPLVRLSNGARYVVAIRKVVDKTGTTIAPAPAFVALRDGTDSTEKSVGMRRALYADIFAKLAAAGIDRSDLQLAWDYTTASDAGLTSALVAMRDDAFAKVGAKGPSYTITAHDDAYDAVKGRIARKIDGTFSVPLYLDSPDPGGKLVRDASGKPMATGTASFPFVVYIPKVATGSGAKPAALLQNGHGLLEDHNQGGDPTTADNDYLLQLATYGYAVFSVDWSGLAAPDEGYIIGLLSGDIGQFRYALDRLHQGVLNAMLAMRMMKGAFAADPIATIGGVATIDATQTYYRGDSQGGILGTTYMALSPDVSRGMIGMTGMGYDLMLQRSADFAPFFSILAATYPDIRDQQIIIGLLSMLWDRVEGTGYAPHVLGAPFAGVPAKQLLVHVAIGDYQVPSLAGEILARSLGVSNVQTYPRSIFGLSDATSPFAGSGIVEWDFGVADWPINTPNPGDASLDPHPKVRTLTASHVQTDTFFRTGKIDMTACAGGPCKGT